MNKQLATLGPLGYMPAPGTCGSLAALPVAYAVSFLPLLYSTLLLIFFTFFSFWCIEQARHYFPTPDPKPIILDEFVGCLWLYNGLALPWPLLLLAFILFRFFDVTKIGIAYFEHIPGAGGILCDDLGAALVTRLIFVIGIWLL